MSQSHYHVFLPPSLPSLSPPIPRLSFQDLTVSRELESQLEFGHASQLSRLKRISQSQSLSHPRPSGHIDRKGKSKEEPSPEYLDGPTTQYNWPPTPIDVIGSGTSRKRSVDEGNTSRGNTIKKSRAPLTLSGNTTTADTTEDQDVSVDVGEASGSRRRSSRVRRSGSGLLGTFPDLETQDESFLSLDTTISSLPPSGEVSSVLNLPKWSIPLTKLSSLPTLLQSHSHKEPQTVSVIVCILSVDTPILRQKKEERRKGQEGSLWIGGWVVTAPNIWVGYAPQGDGSGCGVKLWGEAARNWGDEVVRKGDVVLLENVIFKSPTTTDAAQITISSIPPSKIAILYRTLPRYHLPSNPYAHIAANENGAKVIPGDRELRPDLRLGRSDLGVRRVGEISKWFAGFIGADAPL